MDKFEQNEMTKKRPIESTFFHWLIIRIHRIHKPIRKTISSFKDKDVSLFKAREEHGKQTVYGKGKNSCQLKIQIQSRGSMTKSIRNFFKSKNENEAIKDRTIRYINTLFE